MTSPDERQERDFFNDLAQVPAEGAPPEPQSGQSLTWPASGGDVEHPTARVAVPPRFAPPPGTFGPREDAHTMASPHLAPPAAAHAGQPPQPPAHTRYPGQYGPPPGSGPGQADPAQRSAAGENHGGPDQFGRPAQGFAPGPPVPGRHFGAQDHPRAPSASNSAAGWNPSSDERGWSARPSSEHTLGTPRSADALREHLRAADLIAPQKEPSQQGWRKALHTISGGLINVGESRDERMVRDLKASVAANLRGTYTVIVLGGKGGTGKTAMTIAVGSVFAEQRNDRVVAVDADPAEAANLAARVDPKASSMREINADGSLHRYADVRALTGQNKVGLDVVASPRHGGSRGKTLTADEFKDGHSLLQRFYSVLFVDCGVYLDHEVMSGVLERADAVMMIASAIPDGAEGASTNFEWLYEQGYHHLLSRTVLLINHIRPTRSRKDRKETRRLVAALKEHFGGWVNSERIIEVPFDPHIASAGVLDLKEVTGQTARQALEAAAALAIGFSTVADPR
ncbi:ATPase [Mycobacterium kansasii]|nr:ATPase [Mycobacterium kansasii]